MVLQCHGKIGDLLFLTHMRRTSVILVGNADIPSYLAMGWTNLKFEIIDYINININKSRIYILNNYCDKNVVISTKWEKPHEK